MNKSVTHVILFDGECALCNGLVLFIIKRDPKGKFRFVSMQSEPGRSLLLKYGFSENESDTFVYIRNNKSYQRSSGVIYLLNELGGLWKLFYLFIFIPAIIRDFVYDVIAKNRVRLFGKTEKCALPSSEITNRFIP